MDIQQFQHIRALITEAENKAAKAQGVMEKIEKEWSKSLGEGSLKAAKAKCNEMMDTIRKQEERRDKLMEELEALYDWKQLESDLEVADD